MSNENMQNCIPEYIPLPACLVNAQGKVTGASDRMNEVFIYDELLDSDIFALTGIKIGRASCRERV